MSIVLDASAVLALLYDEPGKDVVMAHALGAHLLSVNLAEVLSRVIDKGSDPDHVEGILARLRFEIVPFGRDLAVAAARLRVPTRHIGASLGDRACLALGGATGLPILTADRQWAKLDLGLDIRLIR